MTHPLIPQIIDLAKPLAEKLGLQVVGAVFQTNQSPPVLRVDICNPDADTSLDDCEKMSKALEMTLDATDLIPDAYVLEISSPGISRNLTTDRDFISFKGFGVRISLSEAFKGHKEWLGNLVGRDETKISLNQKGRVISIPRSLVSLVELMDGS
jgi:ribosome maturation factor RimP